MRMRIICFLLCFSFPFLASANYFDPEESELAFLPEYCKNKASPWADDKNDPRTKRWYAVFGRDYMHMHHYCEGLLSILRGDRAFSGSNKPREYYYDRAIRELGYMENGASKGFKLWPELFVKKGDAFNGQNDVVNAEIYYRKAITKYPNYSIAYMRLVDLYIKLKRLKDARNVNDTAIKRFRKKKAFLRRDETIRLLGENR